MKFICIHLIWKKQRSGWFFDTGASAYTGVPNAKLEVERRIKDCIPVEIGFTAEGWFCLRIPALLPKSRAGRRIISALLYPAMRAF